MFRAESWSIQIKKKMLLENSQTVLGFEHSSIITQRDVCKILFWL